MEQNENKNYVQYGEFKDLSKGTPIEIKFPLPPSLEAVNLKREQERLQDKQIISLLDKRRLIKEAQEQNEADLLFVGYTPPMEAPQPKRMTEGEWHEMFANESFYLYERKGY